MRGAEVCSRMRSMRVTNLDFYGITEGDNMYLTPEDRVIIW